MKDALELGDATAYARAHGLQALLIAHGDEVIAQEYGGGFTPDMAHALYSGAKSFWGIVAACACADGLLTLDEPVAETIETWRDDPWKRRVTPRMLLSLTAGHGFGGLGASVPTYSRALSMPLRYEPGSRFTYGGISFQVFAAFLLGKLSRQHRTPHEYLQQRILDPAGVRIASWRKLSDGTCPAPTGASLHAEQWLRFGRYVLRERAAVSACFQGSSANVRYGLGWWLALPGAPPDLIYASGSAGQALYLIPSLDLSVVHFGMSSSYRHETFLKRLFHRFRREGANRGGGIVPKT